MTNYSYSVKKAWFEDVKNEIRYTEAYEVTEGPWAGQVEIDFATEEDMKFFDKVSEEKGWI